jgi:hypothetical protein
MSSINIGVLSENYKVLMLSNEPVFTNIQGRLSNPVLTGYQKVCCIKKPLTGIQQGHDLRLGTDLLSHVLPQYHRLWRA